MTGVDIVPNHADLVLPLPLYVTVEIGTLYGKDGRQFSIVAGLDQKSAAQLKERSLDPSDDELQQNTSDKRRFGDGSYEEWYAKGRVPFALLDAEQNIAALVWMGPQTFPAGVQNPFPGREWDTVAFRAYVPYRGRGLMVPFSSFVMQTYVKLRPGRMVWLETNVDNTVGQGLFRKLGFQEHGYCGEPRRLVMVKGDVE